MSSLGSQIHNSMLFIQSDAPGGGAGGAGGGAAVGAAVGALVGA